jgi:hypothetical protein
MFSIQKLLGRDEKFYDLLEASAQQADTSVHHLIGLLQKLEQHDTRKTWSNSPTAGVRTNGSRRN